MKFSLAVATMLLACAAAFGQTNPSQPPTPPSGTPQHHHHGRMRHKCTGMGSKDMGEHKGMGCGCMRGKGHMDGSMGMGGDTGTMNDHMADMQADRKDMQSRVDKLRADANKVPDAATKTALLDDADMWEQMMKRMQSHMQHMHGMMGHGMMRQGKMDHGGMHCKMMEHEGMHHDMDGGHEDMHGMDMMDDKKQQTPSEESGATKPK